MGADGDRAAVCILDGGLAVHHRRALPDRAAGVELAALGAQDVLGVAQRTVLKQVRTCSLVSSVARSAQVVVLGDSALVDDRK